MSNTAINQRKSNHSKRGFCPMFNQLLHDRTTAKGRLTWRLDTLGWGAALLWIGTVLLAETSVGPALLGLAAIILGEQILRILFGISVERFWIAVSGLFLLVGAWNHFAITIPLAPLLIASGGVSLVIWALVARHANQK